MEKDWVNIYSTNNVHRAGVIKKVLENNGISTVIVNKQDTVFLTGDIELYVHSDNVIKSKNLIENFKIE